MKAFFVSIPHSGEAVPPEVTWLQGLPEPLLMCDVDRFVDQLYGPAIEAMGVPSVVAHWHRYVVDLNRLPSDIDQDSVVGSSNPPGTFPTGLHWSVTTKGDRLIHEPISMDLHNKLVADYFEPFHAEVKSMFADFKAKGFKKVYQLDAHSMPSMGTAAHRDPGGKRPEIVVSDVDGVSCEVGFKDLVIESYKRAGFEVGYNWPYKGGRVTQTYGQPDLGQHTIQVEMSRVLYMDEATKQIDKDLSKQVQQKIKKAVQLIYDGL